MTKEELWARQQALPPVPFGWGDRVVLPDGRSARFHYWYFVGDTTKRRAELTTDDGVEYEWVENIKGA